MQHICYNTNDFLKLMKDKIRKNDIVIIDELGSQRMGMSSYALTQSKMITEILERSQFKRKENK